MSQTKNNLTELFLQRILFLAEFEENPKILQAYLTFLHQIKIERKSKK